MYEKEIKEQKKNIVKNGTQEKNCSAYVTNNGNDGDF